MKARLWGTRGSIAAAGPSTVRYGGDTSSIEVRDREGSLIILDGGSGIRPLGESATEERRVDILLTHLHMDHVQGLPFYSALLNEAVEVHIWGPVSTSQDLRSRLARYLSPPLFPVRVRELQDVTFHDVLPGEFEVGSVTVLADLINHPGTTLGYRLEEDGRSLAYMPDHEPALANRRFPDAPEWTSGFDLASGVDVLIHDAQYTDDEYEKKAGWGHTSLSQLAAYATMAEVGRLVTFHHDPSHDDETLDRMHKALAGAGSYELIPGTAGSTLEV